MNRVILSINRHPDYTFLCPLTAILWATRTMYRPAILCDKTYPELEFLEDADMIDVYEWDAFKFPRLPNDRLAVKLARWYSYNSFPWMGAAEGDTLLLSDVDLWPISGEFWNRPVTKRVTCFYGDAFQGKRHTTLGFRATCKALQEICPGTWQERLRELRTLPEDDECRHSDDASQSGLVLRWMRDNPGSYELVKRGPSPPVTRIDRGNWPTDFNLNGKVDAHLPRDASDRRVWFQIKPLFDLLAPEFSGWSKAYRDAWERGCP